MASSLPIINKNAIFLSFLLCFLPCISATIKYHNGPLLKGDINLSVLWYGNILPLQKSTFLKFIDSLEDNPKNIVSFEPQVSKWWKMVESYPALADKNKGNTNPVNVPVINVKIVNEIDDTNCSVGENLSKDSIPVLVNRAAGAGAGAGKLNTVAVIFLGKEVGLEGWCSSSSEKCFTRGALGEQLYIVVKNPTEDCVGKCGWPFYHTKGMRTAEFLIAPPNRDAGIDLAIMHAASALASMVTNPFGNGFYDGDAEELVVEIGDVCNGVFGTGAFPGFTGRIHIDPVTGGAFNAHGLNNSKFLLPGLWKPQDSSCWTIM